ncbi:hypothetical protein ACLOJK_035916 [Asimina triloba]
MYDFNSVLTKAKDDEDAKKVAAEVLRCKRSGLTHKFNVEKEGSEISPGSIKDYGWGFTKELGRKRLRPRC